LQTIIDKQKIAEQKFENRKYWLSLKALTAIANYKLSFLFNQLVLLNQLAANPEKNEVFFRVFASECTVTFDEIMLALCDAFGNKYFTRLYEKFIDTDKNPLIKKYLRFYLTNIYNQRGDDAKALQLLDKIKTIDYIDNEYEVLFLARMYELYARIADTKEKRRENLMKFYSAYPQLVPYSGFQMSFRLEVHSSGTNKTENVILKKLENYNINIVGKQENDTPRAKISFTNDGKTDILEFEVSDASGRKITPLTKIAYDDVDVATRKLAYGLFNIIEPVLTVNAIKAPR
jgi:tetratricopeptide (TPR) repeat protein